MTGLYPARLHLTDLATEYIAEAAAGPAPYFLYMAYRELLWNGFFV